MADEYLKFDVINEVLQDWSAMTVDVLQKSIDDAGLEVTHELINSLRVELVRAAADELARAKFFFRLHGRYKDMRTAYTNFKTAGGHKSGFVPVDAMVEFIQKVGIEKFKYIPGYKAGAIPTENNAIRRLAWGLSIGIAKRGATRPKKWYAKTFYAQITPLIDQLGVKMAQMTALAIKNSLDDKSI